ncbi:hypothetical protein A5893_08140 [Pedobacter psychrophilus]|uniref:Anti-bacteriophage protein A/HamA C-terminal domain-containing protein n=1 Tax=Pedobacter psychrophilus TaxID=1826909 RepID=A0A179DER2_9SPHI|nr:Hachiman antiphage defense system protein HamA [Pedobacter psychrophilus]OAQ39555.1 hypothetical protein A5893_08140 [Pedobacter psychrophilus]
MFSEDWSKHIKIDRKLILDQLNQHFLEWDDKLTLRFFTIKPSGTQIIFNGLNSVLHTSLPHYIYGEDDIKRNGEMWAGLNANGKFGLKNPKTDGKYGELLLFVLVESILGCKMVAHKIKSLTNIRDQIKGGDGIFIGDYQFKSEKYPAYLIGESKVTTTLTKALKEALISIERFHSAYFVNDFLDDELIVAKEFLSVTNTNLDELYDRLTPSSKIFKHQSLVHPILLMYSTSNFEKLQKDSASMEILENAISESINGKEKEYLNKINKELDNYSEIKKVYLDFFILPCKSVDEFRDLMYKKIHGVPYLYNVKENKVN